MKALLTISLLLSIASAAMAENDKCLDVAKNAAYEEYKDSTGKTEVTPQLRNKVVTLDSANNIVEVKYVIKINDFMSAKISNVEVVLRPNSNCEVQSSMLVRE